MGISGTIQYSNRFIGDILHIEMINSIRHVNVDRLRMPSPYSLINFLTVHPPFRQQSSLYVVSSAILSPHHRLPIVSQLHYSALHSPPLPRRESTAVSISL